MTDDGRAGDAGADERGRADDGRAGDATNGRPNGAADDEALAEPTPRTAREISPEYHDEFYVADPGDTEVH
ncbi:hypothetical protein MBEHAL_2004 [Halarchaeum acidiphilum MH1-52-1]|uniref:Uncharacterized protein n=1 Tax=Halarchaeum acidiphilum MH1-52-1 TaxID=1261545 RepID=U3A6F3_9EURY|nr:hypothetical protein [Halarchaeum acidiphilum]GAD53244.1 hypothetical protein MBEHAL_2004 [Halarchaeum acidiphilum MH1-52-1]